MAPTIRIDDEVYVSLQSQARPFEDTPNSVMRRILGLGEVTKSKGHSPRPRPVGSSHTSRGEKTSQEAFRAPILTVLMKHNGEIHRAQALKELENAMADQLTDYDKADLNSGTIRWQKSAEWEVRAMREESLLKPVSETSRGVWALTDKGLEIALALSSD